MNDLSLPQSINPIFELAKQKDPGFPYHAAPSNLKISEEAAFNSLKKLRKTLEKRCFPPPSENLIQATLILNEKIRPSFWGRLSSTLCTAPRKTCQSEAALCSSLLESYYDKNLYENRYSVKLPLKNSPPLFSLCPGLQKKLAEIPLGSPLSHYLEYARETISDSIEEGTLSVESLVDLLLQSDWSPRDFLHLWEQAKPRISKKTALQLLIFSRIFQEVTPTAESTEI